MHATGGTGNGFVHQGATEVVGPGFQAYRGALCAHLDPRDLDVPNQGMQHEASHRVHEYGLAESRSRSGAPFTPEGRFHVHITQRHKLGNAACACLQLAQA